MIYELQSNGKYEISTIINLFKKNLLLNLVGKQVGMIKGSLNNLIFCLWLIND